MLTVPTGWDAVRATFGDERPYRGLDGHLRPEWESKILQTVPLPAPLALAWSPDTKVTRVRVHVLVADAFQGFCAEVFDDDLWTYLNPWGGSYADRAQRGRTTKPSLHSFGIAFDADPNRNTMGSATWRMPGSVVDIAARYGWQWGGRFAAPRNDPMHWQYAKKC